MPHIVIEHSVQLEVTELMQELQHMVASFGEFAPSAVKSRCLAFADFCLPEGSEEFVHVTISILAGRALELRLSLADEAFAIMQSHLSHHTKLSLDIREMVAQTYRKN